MLSNALLGTEYLALVFSEAVCYLARWALICQSVQCVLWSSCPYVALRVGSPSRAQGGGVTRAAIWERRAELRDGEYVSGWYALRCAP
jgi:hypothetical protein